MSKKFAKSAAITLSIFIRSGQKFVYGLLTKCPAIVPSEVWSLRARGGEIWALENFFSKKTPFFDQKTKILTHFLNFPGKTPVGISS